ncbi:MAG: protein kinase [Pirellula sp.]
MMYDATLCLHEDEVEQLLSGEMDSVRTAELEQHLANCIECRHRLERQVGNDSWWCETELSLRDCLQPNMASNTDADSPSQLLKLLGPTDDPHMLGRIGPYEIIGLLGQGGMGAVFKGFDRSLNRFVAIKMLLPHLAASGAARKRFAREAQAVAAVVDDHVMAIHRVDEWQGIPYLVMTYSRGVSLQKRLNDTGPLEVREILRIGMQAAMGLAAAHAQGIVHRDIKPANIFLDQNVERVQLMDFGLARAVDDASLTRSGTIAGTPQYMSPEQARAEVVDLRSDLFSLGSVLYAMCVGHAPFRAESSYGVLRLITDKEPRPIRDANPEVPEWLSVIIGKLMSKSPSDRYASAAEVATILGQCLAHVQQPMQYSLPSVAQEMKVGRESDPSIVSQLLRWFPIMNDKRILSLIALILLLMAMLAPWPISAVGNVVAALWFAGSAAVLSIGLALLSRSEYFSRIVLWSFGVTIGLAVVGMGLSVPIWMLRASEARSMAIAAETAARDAKAAAINQQVIAEAAAKQARAKLEQSKGNSEDSAGSMEGDGPNRPGNASQSDSLEGVWEAIHYGDGEEPPESKRLRIVFTKDKHAAFHGTQLLWMASFTIEPQYSPKRLRYVVDGNPRRGIYEIKEDGLRLNVADEIDALPSTFGTKHPEFKRMKGPQARELVNKLMATATKSIAPLSVDRETDAVPK